MKQSLHYSVALVLLALIVVMVASTNLAGARAAKKDTSPESLKPAARIVQNR